MEECQGSLKFSPGFGNVGITGGESMAWWYCLEVHSLYTHFTHFVNPLAAFKFFSLSLVLRNVIIMCHGIVFFISFALGIY